MGKWVLFFAVGVWFSSAGAVEVVLTFDDFPMGTTPLHTKKKRVTLFAEKLAKENIQATFFCIGKQVENLEGKACLGLLGEDQLLAHHSYSHSHASTLSLKEFREDFLRTEALLADLPNYRRWYRFPYLDLGDREQLGGSEQKRANLYHFLRMEGYRHGYVSINTFDWYLNAALLKAIEEKKQIDWDRLRTVYLILLEQWCEDFVQQSQKVETHVLLLHQNDLNAVYLEDIIAMLREKQWEIVFPERAFLSQPGIFVPDRKGMEATPVSLSTSNIDTVLAEHQPFIDQD